MKLRLYVQAADYDDMDLFVNVQKLSTTGEFLPLPCSGSRTPAFGASCGYPAEGWMKSCPRITARFRRMWMSRS